MNHEAVVSNAKEIADRVLAPAARQNDKEGRFSSEAVGALGPAGLLGIMLPAEVGGSALGPRSLAAVIATLAEADASVAMVYLMHMSAAATIAAARPGASVAETLKEIAAGRHLSTLAFSEAGSRSHFWTPVSRAHRNGAGVRITAKKSWVTSAGHAQSYVVSSLAPEGTGPTDSTLYLVPTGARGLSVAGAWDGLGMRANASAPMTLEDCEVASGLQLTDDGAGFQAMLQVVLPLFNLGRESNHEPDNLGGCSRVRSEGGDDLGRHATLLPRGSASTRRGRAVPELRGAGNRPVGGARRSRAAHRHRVEYEPRISAGRHMERPYLPTDRDA
jgi:alkylation response protein AidB-like acyl-CoA dehydrogenase